MHDDDCNIDDMDLQEIEEAYQGLVSKGILKEIVVDGFLDYEIVPEVKAVMLHYDSDPKTRN